jgi:hypothetical protein|tara:strand:+ start:1004 stop:1462 length:459 start_codon:yes stop_codon:yes gene_type:complete
LNLLLWYSRISDDEENVTLPGAGQNEASSETKTSPSYDFDFTFDGLADADFSWSIDDPGFVLPTGSAFAVGKGTVVLDSTGTTKTTTMQTPLDGGLGYLDLGNHLDSKNINWKLLTEAPAKLALIMSPVMSLPMIWVDPVIAWFDSQEAQAL